MTHRQPIYWTLDQVAEAFGVTRRTFVARLPEFQAAGFPMPLPWNRRCRRYCPDAVLAWKRRYEIRMRAQPPDLKSVA